MSFLVPEKSRWTVNLEGLALCRQEKCPRPPVLLAGQPPLSGQDLLRMCPVCLPHSLPAEQRNAAGPEQQHPQQRERVKSKRLNTSSPRPAEQGGISPTPGRRGAGAQGKDNARGSGALREQGQCSQGG